jgi:hypothetical protein
LVSAIGFESSSDKESRLLDNEGKSRIISTWTSAEHLLASMPLRWSQKILSADALCIDSEFTRYQTLKLMFEYREEIRQIKLEKASEESDSTLPSALEDASSAADQEETLNYSSYFGSLMGSSRKKRKRVQNDQDGPEAK